MTDSTTPASTMSLGLSETFIVPFRRGTIAKPYAQIPVGATFILADEYDVYMEGEGVKTNMPTLFVKLKNACLAVGWEPEMQANAANPHSNVFSVEPTTPCYEMRHFNL